MINQWFIANQTASMGLSSPAFPEPSAIDPPFPRLSGDDSQDTTRNQVVDSLDAALPPIEWSSRASCPAASQAGKGHQRQGARHVSEDQHFNIKGELTFRNAVIDGGEAPL
jgi:hypothetical protein